MLGLAIAVELKICSISKETRYMVGALHACVSPELLTAR